MFIYTMSDDPSDVLRIVAGVDRVSPAVRSKNPGKELMDPERGVRGKNSATFWLIGKGGGEI